jgi:hypothetical protein
LPTCANKPNMGASLPRIALDSHFDMGLRLWVADYLRARAPCATGEQGLHRRLDGTALTGPGENVA